jgi:hypothetical protein
MEAGALVITVLGTVAGIAGAYFAWVAVRRPRRTPAGAPKAPTGGRTVTREDPVPTDYDAFICYADDDADWVDALAGRLRQEGIKVAYDRIVLLPGDPVAHSIEQAIRDSAHGLLVYGSTAHENRWVREEYQVLLGRAVTGDGRRLIPIIVKDAELPLFAANRYHLDFRNASEVEYERLVALLVRALRT